MDLYHYQVGFPAWFNKLNGIISLTYSGHAQREALVDRYGAIGCPSTLDTKLFKVIEIGVVGKCVEKILFRGALDANRDICIVVTKFGTVKTVWVNLRTDLHKTLDATKYKRP